MIPGRTLGWLVFGALVVALFVGVLPPVVAAVVAAVAVVSAGILAQPWGRGPSAEPAGPPPTGPPARDQIAALLDLFSEGILLLDEENTVIVANRAAAQLLDRPPERMTGVSLIRAARDHAFVEILRESAAEPREVEIGDHRVIFATATPVDSGDIRTVLTLQDLTSLRRAERARQDLIANVSHELRTPIAAALALAETLEGGVAEREQRERFSRQLVSEIERLGRIVDRLLRLSRIESRTEEFALAPVDVATLVQEAAQRIAPVAERQVVPIHVEIPGGLPPVRADRERVLEVLANLLDNAIRYSPAGAPVSVTAQRQGHLMRIDVRDRGPGVAPQDRLRIFERFYTGDRAREYGQGTGLGLSIARHIISRHGGDIWVADSAPGATFAFTLPVAEAPAPAPVPTEDRSGGDPPGDAPVVDS